MFILSQGKLHSQNLLLSSRVLKVTEINSLKCFSDFRDLQLVSTHNLKIHDLQVSVNDKIFPFFSRTIWFKIFLVICILLFVILLVYSRTRSIEKQKSLLEKLVNEKTIDLQQVNHLLEEKQEEIILQKEEIEVQNLRLIEQSKKILQQNHQLEKYSLELEEKVRERTSELEKAKQKAEESDRLKSAFLANMSHEIRTPLNSIIGFSNLLVNIEGEDEERKKVFFDHIRKNSDLLLNLINDIIDLSKIEAGLLPIQMKPVKVNELLTELMAVFENEKYIHDRGHMEMRLSIPEKKYLIQTDPLRFEQILKNLIHNALKYSEQGFIEAGFKETEGFLEFYIKDTGIGIPRDKLEVIFNRFVKLDSPDTKLYAGAGLGLSICNKLCSMLGGKIWAESTLGTGTTFYFTLPLK